MGYDVGIANPPVSYRSLSGPPGPKSEKNLKKSPRAGGPRAPKRLEKVSKKSRTDILETFSRLSDLFETFSRLFGAPGPEAPGDSFQTVWGFRARTARETPVARWRVHNVGTKNESKPGLGGCPRNGSTIGQFLSF